MSSSCWKDRADDEEGGTDGEEGVRDTEEDADGERVGDTEGDEEGEVVQEEESGWEADGEKEGERTDERELWGGEPGCGCMGLGGRELEGEEGGDVWREEAGEAALEGEEREETMDARVGRGLSGLTRPGRAVNFTGKPTWVAAAFSAIVVAWSKEMGDWERVRRESLMVGPVVQPALRRTADAADKDSSSRWPRQILMVR